MQHDFPYQPGYVGELDSFSPDIANDLKRLVSQLDSQLVHDITKEKIPYFRNERRFRQIVAVEELDSRPALVGTANLSFVQHSYDTNGNLTNLPATMLGSFVVDENVRGKGVAVRIWNKILEISLSENVHRMQFTSKPARGAAHGFYAKMGAEQFTPIKAIKYIADGTETTAGTSIPYDEQLELAKGHVVFIFSEAGAEPVDETTARQLMANCGADRFEQLIPTTNQDEATTILFSVSY